MLLMAAKVLVICGGSVASSDLQRITSGHQAGKDDEVRRKAQELERALVHRAAGLRRIGTVSVIR